MPRRKQSEAISEARRRLMLTDEQAARSYELRQFIQLRPQLLEAEVKPWRLQVKRRLNKKHKEELDGLLVGTRAQVLACARRKGGGSQFLSFSGCN